MAVTGAAASGTNYAAALKLRFYMKLKHSMINDPFHPEEAIAREHDQANENCSQSFALLASLQFSSSATVTSASITRKKFSLNNTPPPVVDSGPKGPALAHVVVDEPTLDKRHDDDRRRGKEHFEAGINGLSVVLELRRRKDGGLEESVLPVTPAQLQPEQEGSYS